MGYSLMLDRIQNIFVSRLYLRQYGVHPFYLLIYVSLVTFGMVENNELHVRRNLSLADYLLKVIGGMLYNPILSGPHIHNNTPSIKYLWS